MSMMLMVEAMKAKVGNPLRKLVLIKLADNANDLGECWPSYKHIADQCEISKRSAMNHIAELEKMGLLRKEHREGKHHKNASNRYVLTIGAGDPLVQEIHQGGAGDSLGGSAGAAPRTSHSLEPINEPISASAKIKKKTKAQNLVESIRQNPTTHVCLNQLDNKMLKEWADLRIKKGASCSGRALATIENTLQTLRTVHGIAPDDAIAAQLDSGWATIKVEYLLKSSPFKAYNSPGSERRGPDQPIHISQDHRELTDEERKKGSVNIKQIQGLMD